MQACTHNAVMEYAIFFIIVLNKLMNLLSAHLCYIVLYYMPYSISNAIDVCHFLATSTQSSSAAMYISRYINCQTTVSGNIGMLCVK